MSNILKEAGLAELVTKIKEIFAKKDYFKVEQTATEGNKIGEVKIGDTTTELFAPVVQSDWNQNDEDADDYIKNRTHYRETDAGINFTTTPAKSVDEYSRIVNGTTVYGIYYAFLPEGTVDLRNRDLTFSYVAGGTTYTKEFRLSSPISRTYTSHKEGWQYDAVTWNGWYGNTMFIEDVALDLQWDSVPDFGNSYEDFAFFYISGTRSGSSVMSDGICFFVPYNNVTSCSIVGGTEYIHPLDSRLMDLKVVPTLTEGNNIANFYGTDHVFQIYATPTPPIYTESGNSIEIPPNSFMYCSYSDGDNVSINLSSTDNNGMTNGEDAEYENHINTWEFAIKAPNSGVLEITNDYPELPIQWNQPLTGLTAGKWYYCKVYGYKGIGYWGTLNKAASQGIVKGTITLERTKSVIVCTGSQTNYGYNNLNFLMPTDKIYQDPTTGEKTLIAAGDSRQSSPNSYLPLWNFDYMTIELDTDYAVYDSTYDRYNGPSIYLRASSQQNTDGDVRNKPSYNNNNNFNLKIFTQPVNETATTKYEYYSMLNPITYVFDGWTMRCGESSGGYTNNYCCVQTERLTWQTKPKMKFNITMHFTELVAGS